MWNRKEGRRETLKLKVKGRIGKTKDAVQREGDKGCGIGKKGEGRR